MGITKELSSNFSWWLISSGMGGGPERSYLGPIPRQELETVSGGKPEASQEKTVLARIAPHLSQPLPFIFPTRKASGWPRWTGRPPVRLAAASGSSTPRRTPAR